MTGSRSLTFSTARRPKRRRWVRVVTWLVVLALGVAVLAVVAGGLLWSYAWVRLGSSDLPSLAAEGEDALGAGGATSPEGTTTVLVAITDAGDPTDPAPAPLAGPVLLVQTGGPRGEDAVVLTLPEDLPVSVDGEAPMTLDEVATAGGTDLLLRSVVDYTQIAVDHAVTASTAALPDLVEAVGPLEVCTTGCTEVDAAGVSSMLDGYAGDDPAASAAAVEQLAAVLRTLGEATDPVGIITSPWGSKRAIDVLADEVVTDVSLRGAASLPLADAFAELGTVEVVQLPGVRNPDSGQLLLLPEQAATRFAVLREGGVTTTSPEDDEAALLADVTVVVQNGTGTAGYAARLEAQLTALGVRVAGTENALGFDHDTTQVAYGPDDPAAEAAAIVLARELGGDVELVALERRPTFEGDPVAIQVIGGADLDTEQES